MKTFCGVGGDRAMYYGRFGAATFEAICIEKVCTTGRPLDDTGYAIGGRLFRWREDRVESKGIVVDGRLHV